ncbi:MAG: HAMP domain-containing sensor histidine kinase [Nitriliruptor sp.]|uniref:sensor histidine kinase n=1 Tax=Nitriliruptor sp. TaxID=2448056 RepID=UPI00349FE9EC
MSAREEGQREIVGDVGRVPTLDDLIDALSRASVGRDVRIAVDPTRSEPFAVVGAAINILLEDLTFRQREREEALHRVAIAEAKREFLAYLSHDMQTPLAMLLGALDLLDPDATVEEVTATVPLMRQAVGTLQRLVQQFLDLARLDADRPLELTNAPMDLRVPLERATTLFADRGRIEITYPAELPMVHGDAGRVEQVVTNLLANAFKYARDPGIHVVSHTDTGCVDVTIADRGEGLSEQDLEHVFGQFDRGAASARAAGTGLGLFISRALAEAMGGSLFGTSRPGEGSRFTLSLPVVGRDDGETDRASEPVGRSSS